jgi:hypothetical protein
MIAYKLEIFTSIIDKIIEICKKLSEIALKPNTYQWIDYFEGLIEHEIYEKKPNF